MKHTPSTLASAGGSSNVIVVIIISHIFLLSQSIQTGYKSYKQFKSAHIRGQFRDTCKLPILTLIRTDPNNDVSCNSITYRGLTKKDGMHIA